MEWMDHACYFLRQREEHFRGAAEWHKWGDSPDWADAYKHLFFETEAETRFLPKDNILVP